MLPISCGSNTLKFLGPYIYTLFVISRGTKFNMVTDIMALVYFISRSPTQGDRTQ